MFDKKLLFLFGCIPARMLLAYFTTVVPLEYLKYYGLILLAISIGFFWLYFTNTRLDAPEAGGTTWWSSFRPIFGALYLIAAIYCFQGKQNLAWIPLAIEIIFGLILFILNELK